MNIVENENFPRGGKKNSNEHEKMKRKYENSLFNTERRQKTKKARREKSVENHAANKELWQTSLNFQGTLTYNKLQEGMLILSCVRHISSLALQIEFPGLTFATVTINQISEDFTKSLSDQLKMANELNYNPLTNVLRVGQLIPAQVLAITKTERGHEVQATVNPKIINSSKKHNSFKKGATLWANVVSELDHGYELTLGVNNCRVFLPFKNVDDEKKYGIGEPLYCKIHKIDSSEFATTLTVSAKQEHIGKFQETDLTLVDVIPGMRVNFLIEEVLSKGYKGHFLDNCFGYIDKTQIFSTTHSQKLKEGNIVPAYVLFVEPITKVTYLSLRGLENLAGPYLTVGKVMSAKVISTVPKGLYLQLDQNCIGFVTNKRLLNTLPKEARLDITETVRKKYPIESRHDCRILDYNYMDQLYICTFEKRLVKEKIFSTKDLNIGQIVTVKVDKITPSGLIVKSGHLQGFVPNLHLSNVKYSENIKSKFNVGMNTTARVLNITSGDNVIFTLKQSLVESEKCLMKLADALPGSHYSGFVVQTKISGALISFYGNVKGWISNKVLNAENSGRYTDPRDFFFIGQVVTVWILGLKDNKLQVSLNAPNMKKRKAIKIGQHLDGTVTAVHSDNIDIALGPEQIEATIPIAHLSSSLFLCSVLQKIYKPGYKITDLMCINNTNIVPVMSRRESIAYKKKSLKVCQLRDLKRNMLLRCSFEEKSESGIFISAPIENYSEKIFVPTDNNNEERLPSFTKQQCIITKVLNVNYDSKKIDVTILKETISNTDVNNMIESLIETIEDIDYIIRLCEEKNAKLTDYKIGERVECAIKYIDASGDVHGSLPNGTNGVIPAQLKPANCVVGSVIEGVVLDYNFIDNFCIICGKKYINQKISNSQDGFMSKTLQSSCLAKVVFINKCYAIGILHDSLCNKQLVYLPLYFNEDKTVSYEEKVKIVIYRKIGNRIIGVPKKIFLSLNKAAKKEKREKRKGSVVVNKFDETISYNHDNNPPINTVNNSVHLDKLGIENLSDAANLDENKNLNSKLSQKMQHDEVPILENLDSRLSQKMQHDEVPILENLDSKLFQKIQYDEVPNQSVLSATTHLYYRMEDEINRNESSSEEEEENVTPKKKKKLSAAEKAEAVKEEEARITKIEKELADAATTPQAAEQFDRLLLANPNSSELWLQYISMHAAATELEKARAIGRKAIETINMTLTKEKFNIWIALLNLENMYGTKESFEELFEEAVKYNDALDIYLNVIKMFATSEKLSEMEEKIKKLKAKEKQNTKMWLEIGRVYYSLKKFKQARGIKEAAIKTILDRKRQFDLIVRFGIMEFQLGVLEQAIANFETILETYPAKVNMWIIYVDQLIKQKKIDFARKVLERAIRQTFNIKTMKILFQKFISFEEHHGTPETVDNVKSRAKEYLANLGVK